MRSNHCSKASAHCRHLSIAIVLICGWYGKALRRQQGTFKRLAFSSDVSISASAYLKSCVSLWNGWIQAVIWCLSRFIHAMNSASETLGPWLREWKGKSVRFLTFPGLNTQHVGLFWYQRAILATWMSVLRLHSTLKRPAMLFWVKRFFFDTHRCLAIHSTDFACEHPIQRFEPECRT